MAQLLWRTLFNTCLQILCSSRFQLPLTPSYFSTWHCPEFCFIYVAIPSHHHDKASGFSRLVLAMVILYRGWSSLGQVSYHDWSHTTAMELEQEHRPDLVPYAPSSFGLKPGVTGMTCICRLVSYLSIFSSHRAPRFSMLPLPLRGSWLFSEVLLAPCLAVNLCSAFPWDQLGSFLCF